MINIFDLQCDENDTRLMKIESDLKILNLSLKYVGGKEAEIIKNKIEILNNEREKILNENKIPEKPIMHAKVEDLDDDLIDGNKNTDASIDDVEVCDGINEMEELTNNYIKEMQAIMYNNLPEKKVAVGYKMSNIIHYLEVYDEIISLLNTIQQHSQDEFLRNKAISILSRVNRLY